MVLRVKLCRYTFLFICLISIAAAAQSVPVPLVYQPNPAEFSEINNCGSAVAAKGSCTINVTFNPSATGSRSAAITITDNGGGSPQSVGLFGTGD